MTRYAFHKNRPVREILRQDKLSRQQGFSDSMVLDNANDAWLSQDGSVSTRQSGPIGNVAHYHGAARVSAALAIVTNHRA